MEDYTISSGELTVCVRAHGAELTSIRHESAGEMLWQAGPVWPKHAPVLFPVVGQLANETLRYDGRSYHMARHGFARERDFQCEDRTPASVTLRLVDDAATREIYPFRFAFTLRYEVEGSSLVTTFAVHNPGTVVLPASTGGHPAFIWPLAPGVPMEAHTLTFAKDEPEPIRRLAGSQLDPHPFPSPIVGRELHLDPSLFDADAIVMDKLQSGSVRYSAPGTAAVDVAWSGFRELGIWSLRGGEFLCVEPWYGFADPAGFEGDFLTKPGLALIPPGETATYEMRITIVPA